MNNPYRSNQIVEDDNKTYSLLNKFLDRLLGESCSCPDCHDQCFIDGKRPKLFSKYHGWIGWFPFCIFGIHNFADYDGIVKCVRCATRKRF